MSLGAQLPAQNSAGLATRLAPRIVLTEYVPGESRQPFLKALASHGLAHSRLSVLSPGHNHVLIASRAPLEEGSIRAEAVVPAFPSNVLHVRLPLEEMDVLGVRIPDLGKKPALKRACWDWIVAAAEGVVNGPFVMLGDFNTDPDYPRAKCGEYIGRLVANGWQSATPTEGASYRTLKGNEVRIDRAFATRHFVVRAASYVARSNGYLFAGNGREALSDHAVLLVDLDRAGSLQS